jgi:hypothetical protein
MKKAEGIVLWVVYRMTFHRKPVGMYAVCEQSEWDSMELDRPGYHTLVRAGITNEGEAERLARDESGSVAKPLPARQGGGAAEIRSGRPTVRSRP